GDIGCFSLYATKNMISGEGGIVTTNNDEYAELVRRFRHHGQSEQTRYEYHDLGYNYRMTDLHAAIALGQLEKIEEYTNTRIENAKMLTDGLKEVKGIAVPVVNINVKHVFHQYTIRVDGYKLTRDELKEELHQKGIGSAVFYPKPLHLHPHFSRMGYKEGDFPVSENASKKVLSLPVHPSVTKEEIKKIIDAIKC
ncbi:MAG: DegT/DnrJ/EryC1/StrS family aminotransferase, partial [Nanoarchaeota archaeon]|nr:DegT/DnrJ/EryC1/StrS family aminotransferase [Nanoarchaeota archaeon]